jgi:hypothetical protein
MSDPLWCKQMPRRSEYSRSWAGCLRCKARRVKCDQVHPTCSGCLRQGEPCEYLMHFILEKHTRTAGGLSKTTDTTRIIGVGDSSSLLPAPDLFKFRDKTQSVVQKAQSGQNTKRRKGLRHATASQDTQAVLLTTSSSLLPLTPLARIQSAISPSIESQATCFFVHNYVLAESAHARDQLVCLLRTSAQNSETLLAAMVAVGMAGMSNIRRDSNLSMLARQKYIFAVRRTNELLRDPIQATTDEIFTAVSVLAFFEVGYSANPNYHSQN